MLRLEQCLFWLWSLTCLLYPRGCPELYFILTELFRVWIIPIPPHFVGKAVESLDRLESQAREVRRWGLDAGLPGDISCSFSQGALVLTNGRKKWSGAGHVVTVSQGSYFPEPLTWVTAIRRDDHHGLIVSGQQCKVRRMGTMMTNVRKARVVSGPAVIHLNSTRTSDGLGL